VQCERFFLSGFRINSTQAASNFIEYIFHKFFNKADSIGDRHPGKIAECTIAHQRGWRFTSFQQTRSNTKSAFITPFSSSGVFSPLHPAPAPCLSQDKGGSQPGFGINVWLESTEISNVT
jgi:hypothetical protein